jgi:hypothetical protein
MDQSKRRHAALKAALETAHNRPVTGDEVDKATDLLRTLAQLQVAVMLEDHERQEQLKTSPGGFHLKKEGCTCRICHTPASGEDSWFDAYGLKCIRCQTAINQNIIPPTVATDPDSYYTAHELEQNFALTAKIRRQWIKKGRLISRTITHSDKRPPFELFLISDNATLLPPKHLVQSRMTTGTIDDPRQKLSS